MADKKLYDEISGACSRNITKAYSTSFSLGIMALSAELRPAIYGIYGFVRLADEIVDTFHDYPKATLLQRFREDTYRAIEEKISLNPVLNSFQYVVNRYDIPSSLIEKFLESMETDLKRSSYDEEQFNDYVLGSAEVVGLMCLRVFCDGNEEQYRKLTPAAMSLGAAFQKINFLRDLGTDYYQLGRSYFPGIPVKEMKAGHKKQIEENIKTDFRDGLNGIKMLPESSRFGVYLAYVYFYALFRKISSIQAGKILSRRIRIPDHAKVWLLIRSLFYYHLKLM